MATHPPPFGKLKASPFSLRKEGEYNAQDQLTQYGANTYTYTLKGELETRGGIDGITHYSYDPMGNLSQAVLPNNTVIGYTYDAQGRLIAKRVNGVVKVGVRESRGSRGQVGRSMDINFAFPRMNVDITRNAMIEYGK